MKTVFTLKDLVKYVIFISIVYTLMIIIPSQKIITTDLILIVSVISFGFILIDCLSSNSELFSNIIIDSNTLREKAAVLSNIVETKQNSFATQINKNSSNLTNMVNEIKSFPTQINNQLTNLTNMVDETKQINNQLTNLTNMVDETKQINNIDNNFKESNDTTTIKYMNLLIDDLRERNVLNNNDIENIKAKINSKILTDDEIIIGLEKLILTAKAKQKKEPGSEYMFGNVSSDLYKPLGNTEITKWDEGYNMLNTNKWQIPINRPPVCINTTPCKVCPDTEDTYPLKLALWDNSRKISNTEISKDWANKQIDPNENIV
jgi:hypothetical protein